MKVIDLKNALENLPDDMEVVRHKDELSGLFTKSIALDDNVVYVAVDNQNGDVYNIGFSHEDVFMNKSDWEKIKSLPRVLLIS
jgi:hypothetical protein